MEAVEPATARGHPGVLRVTGADGATHVVKIAGQDPFEPADPGHGQAWGFFAEVVGAAFVGSLPGHLSAAFVGADAAVGVVVLEDLGPGLDLADLLLGNDAAAAAAGLRQLATALGRLHAAAAGREADYRALWDRLVPAGSGPPVAGWWFTDGLHSLRRACPELGLAVSPAAEADLHAVASAIAEPQLRTYVHGDPCPDNVRPGAREARLLDFQAGGYGLALLDGAYARAGFPTCWCTGRLPNELVREFELTYRAELVNGVPGALDDGVFNRALVAACAHWFVVHAGWRLPRALAGEVRQPEMYRGWRLPGDREQLLLRADSFVAASREFGGLKALADLVSSIAERLRARWSGEVVDAPLYPAFG